MGLRDNEPMIELEVLAADVTKLDVDAIADAANTQLRHGGGVAAAISRAGGPDVQRESTEKAPIGLGEAIETTAGDMPARYVIHAATMELGGPTSPRSSAPPRLRHCARPTSSGAARWGWWPSAPVSAGSRSTRPPG